MGGFHFTGCALKYKSEPEHQAQMEWARSVVSKIIIPDESQFQSSDRNQASEALSTTRITRLPGASLPNIPGSQSQSKGGE